MKLNIIHILLPLTLSMSAFGQKKAAAPAADYLAEGHEAFMNYDFELASELYEKYAKVLKNRPDEDGERLLEKFRRQLEIAENSLDNVQKIEVIDRVDLPLQDFLSAISLPANEGRFLAKNKVPVKGHYNDSDFVFSTGSGDVMMWTEQDENGISHLFESTKLVDGSWEPPTIAGDVLNDGGNVRNPFMLSDGVTVYFAGDGDSSMGGYDLFVASKDPATGEYLQPTGVGYPFNSPSNEYMLAIDEDNGIGWWVTDRNEIDGQVSVYVFYTNDVRKNYNPDEVEDLVPLAKLDDISLAQNPETDYEAVISEINGRGVAADGSSEESEILFRLPGGRVVRKMSDLHSSTAKRNLTQYLSAEAEFKANKNQLQALRMKYHAANDGRNASQSLKNQILDLEKKIEWQQDKLKKMSNSIIQAESK